MLVCVECGSVSADGDGWRAEIANDPSDDEPAEVAVYAPRAGSGRSPTPGRRGLERMARPDVATAETSPLAGVSA